MTEEIQKATSLQRWKAEKIVKKAKKIAVKKLLKDGIPEKTARNLVKHAAKRMAQGKSNVSLQEPTTDL